MVQPTKGLVEQYSTGSGEQGEQDVAPQWAPKHGFQTVDNPAFNPEKVRVNG